MAAERMYTSLQENILTILCHDDTHGKIVSALADPQLFEPDYKVIAERAIDYWKKHKKAPKAHVDDLLSDFIDDPNNRKAKTFKRIIIAMLTLHEGMNTVYVVEQLRKFARMQRLKEAIFRSADRLSKQQEMAIDEIEEIWADLLRSRELTFDTGTRLDNAKSMLEALEHNQSEFITGIEVLDRRHIVPHRGEVMMLIGAAKSGKTWFLTQIGKNAIKLRKKVVHISLEVSEEIQQQRYYQATFAIPKRDIPIEVTEFDFADPRTRKKFEGVSFKKARVDFAFDDPKIGKLLERKIEKYEARFHDVIIKRFPTRRLTIAQLEAYLDGLEVSENFIPDMLIVDYPGIMKTNENNFRISLSTLLEDFRGVCVERNLAGVVVHQSSKLGAMAKEMNVTHIAEAWAIIGTMDQVLLLSASKQEKERGLARITVGAARSEEDKFSLLITQNYNIGQFCLDSIYLDRRVTKVMKGITGEEAEEEAEREDDRE